MEELIQLANPLLEFGKLIGLDREDFVQQEELEQIIHENTEFQYEKFKLIPLLRLESLVKTYGEAFKGSFSFAGDSLEIDSSLDDKKFNSFQAIVGTYKTSLKFEFELNKTVLIEQLKNDLLKSTTTIAFCHKIFLYLFVESLEKKLRLSSLEELESTFWGTEAACKIIFLIPEHKIYLNGAYLSILGGQKLQNLSDALTYEVPNQESIKSMYDKCQDIVRWKGIDIKSLTPLHFRVQGEAAQDDPIARAIYLYQAKMIVLYTADQTVVGGDKQYVATYSGEKQRKEIILNDLSSVTNEQIRIGTDKLLERVEGIYSSPTTEDAISLFQLVIVRALQITEPSDCYRLLLLKADYIVNEFRWLWKTFAEGKIDGYIGQVKALEDYVASVIQSFADQVSSMVKNLSDTMLAAVGVTLASFIAALFKDSFNPTIFRIGIIAYGVYVLIFPLIYNMSYQQQYFKTLLKNFIRRRKRFQMILDPNKVNEIVNRQLKDSKKRFKNWFKIIKFTYIAVFFLALIAAFVVPCIVPQTPSVQKTSPSIPSSPKPTIPSVSPSPINPVAPNPKLQPVPPKTQQKGTPTTSPSP